MVAKTVFTSNVPKVSIKNVYVPPAVIVTVPVIINEDIYKNLSDYSLLLQNLFYNYSLGNFKYVASVLTNKYYQELSIKISRITFSDYPIYEQLRKTIKFSLQGIYKAINEYSKLQNTKLQLKNMTEKASILNDIDKLKEYINGLRGTMYLLPDLNIKAPLATVKREYVEYIKLYGYPSGGIFDMDRLAAILINIA
jgi:hypothetical protein